MRIIPNKHNSLLNSLSETESLLANKKILVCSGDRLTLTASMLTNEIKNSIIGGATTEDEALDIFFDKQPNLLITSENLERGYGIRLVEKVKKYRPNTKALIFLHREKCDVVKEAREAGADGVMFVSNIGSGDGDFINALRITSKGGIYLPKCVSCSNSKPLADTIEPLSIREKQVVKCMVAGMKNTEIAKELTISPETVKSHVSTTIHKLGVRDRTQAVVFALTHDLANM